MRNRSKRNFLLLAAALGLLTAMSMFIYIDNFKQPQLVVVATKNISAGSIVEADMVKFRSLVVSDSNLMTKMSEVIGKVTINPILKDTPITGDQLENPSGLSYNIPPGMRAISVAIDPVIGVAGFLEPGARVDVIATSDRDGQARAETVLQNVRLLAVGTDANQKVTDGNRPADPTRQTVTLVTTLYDSQKMILAESKGKLRLVLRGHGDNVVSNTAPVTTKRRMDYGAIVAHLPSPTPKVDHRAILDGMGPTFLPVPPAPLPLDLGLHQIEVIRGSTREWVTVPQI